MSFTNPYWVPGPNVRAKKYLKRISNSLGFQFNLPAPDPVTAGWYYGVPGPIANENRKRVTDPRPEFFAVGNIMPTVGGIPRMNPHSEEMKFSRKQYTKNVSR